MGSAGVAIIILLAAWALTCLILGLWVRKERRKSAKLRAELCELQNDARGDVRAQAIAKERERRKGLTSDELMAEINSGRPSGLPAPDDGAS